MYQSSLKSAGGVAADVGSEERSSRLSKGASKAGESGVVFRRRRAGEAGRERRLRSDDESDI